MARSWNVGLGGNGRAGERDFGFCRRRSKDSFGRDVGPRRLCDRGKDWCREISTRAAVAEGAPLAIRIIVSKPDRDGDVVGKACKPGVVFVVRCPGLAGSIS